MFCKSGILIFIFAENNCLVRQIPGTVEPDGLPSMGSNRVGHNWSNLAAAAAAACLTKKHTLTEQSVVL